MPTAFLVYRLSASPCWTPWPCEQLLVAPVHLCSVCYIILGVPKLLQPQFGDQKALVYFCRIGCLDLARCNVNIDGKRRSEQDVFRGEKHRRDAGGVDHSEFDWSTCWAGIDK